MFTTLRNAEYSSGKLEEKQFICYFQKVHILLVELFLSRRTFSGLLGGGGGAFPMYRHVTRLYPGADPEDFGKRSRSLYGMSF